MNGYISDKLTFSNALHTSPKYPRKLESFKVAHSNTHYFMDDLFQMILLNLHTDRIQVRIIESEYNNNEDWNAKSTDNLYHSYHHKKFKKRRLLFSHLKEATDTNYFREFYGVRTKYDNLKKALED